MTGKVAGVYDLFDDFSLPIHFCVVKLMKIQNVSVFLSVIVNGRIVKLMAYVDDGTPISSKLNAP